MELSFISNNTNISCQSSLLWTQAGINHQKSRLYVSIIACIIHAIFWLQLLFYSSLRQKSMQWIYAYLITDILLLFQFFFVYIVRTKSTQCETNQSWVLFVNYLEAVLDDYLNILQVYIILALNICRYIQIAYNRNIYLVHKNLFMLTHFCIYLISLLFFIIEFLVGWVEVVKFDDGSSVADYKYLYVQIFNIIIGFALPIILNISVIYISIRHVHLTSALRTTQHHVSAREKYHHSLVIQFLLFYVIWISLWSPDIIVCQLSDEENNVTNIVQLLTCIGLILDPIIIGALDVRFWHAWRKTYIHIKNTRFFGRPNRRRIEPVITNLKGVSVKTPQIQKTTFLTQEITKF